MVRFSLITQSDLDTNISGIKINHCINQNSNLEITVTVKATEMHYFSNLF